MNLIRQHIFDIDCSSKTIGKDIHNQLGMLLEQQFYPKLDIMLDNYGISGHHLTIDTLELELPVISSKNWKKELVAGMLQQLETFLMNLAPQTKVNHTESYTSDKVESLQTVTDAQQAETLFFSFLETGVLRANTVSSQLEKLIASIEVELRFTERLLEHFLKNKDSLMRWIFSIPAFFRAKVADMVSEFPSDLKVLLSKSEISDLAVATSNLKKGSPKTLPTDCVEMLQWLLVLYSRNPEKQQFYAGLAVEFANSFFSVSARSLYKTISRVNQLLSTDIKQVNTSVKLFLKVLEQEINQRTTDKKNSDFTNSPDTIVSLEKDKIFRESIQTVDAVQFIANAGLVILHPFLKPLFTQLGLCNEDDSWRNAICAQKAILLLEYLVTGKTECTENELVLNKLLCGLPAQALINVKLHITKKEKEKCNILLAAVLEHWEPLNKSSVEALRETFLQREGRLETKENAELWVEEKGYDILLDKLPWAIGTIKTPWMENYLTCYWN